MRLLKQITLLLAIIALLGGLGCANKRIGATHDPFFVFPATAQWSWDEHLNLVPDNPSIVALNVPAIVRELITEGLEKRGYVMVPKGTKVDFRVHYQVGLGQRGTASSVKGFGSLSLTLVDDTTNRDVWVGFVRTESNVSRPESERRKRLKKQINTMLNKFPPS
jgi:hypothetical protein